MKKQKFAPEYRRTTAEYVLMTALVGLFAFGIWAYTTGGRQDDTVQNTPVAEDIATPEGIATLADKETSMEQSAEASQDDTEAASSSVLEGAADNFGGSYDETAY